MLTAEYNVAAAHINLQYLQLTAQDMHKVTLVNIPA